jgi:hypothetical protein
MSFEIEPSRAGGILIRDGSRIWIDDLSIAIGGPTGAGMRAGDWIRDGNCASQPLLRNGRRIAEVDLVIEGDVATVRLDLHSDLEGLYCADSFEQSHLALPQLRLPQDLSYFLVTYGLGRADDPLGGYWPTARVGTVRDRLPEQAFAPLVLYDSDGAVAIAPASQFLTSALLAVQGGLARILHGSVDRLIAGTRIETILARGANVADALSRLGDVLLARTGKARPSVNGSILTSGIGWWNAYGGFFTEPIRPLTAERLVEVGEGLRRVSVPVRYFGLDLWYPYQQIGQAIRFVPDPDKYPAGLRPIADRFELPMVLHLSARSPEGSGPNDGADPTVYREIAAELKRQGAIVAWHDWLRTQQHLTPRLRSDPVAADRWFTEMASALEKGGLELLMCMQTMGMVLASSGTRNATAARSAIDYLFGQPEAFDTLDRLGHIGFRREALPAREVWRQNLLVGSVLYAFGLLPFHDLFLTVHHPGLGGTAARVDALLRALSCGPVGIGDAPGRTDATIVRSLLDASGRILRPDHPPLPDTASLGTPVEVYRTVHVAGDACWDFILLLNTTDRPQHAVLPGTEEDAVMWDVLGRRLIQQARVSLAPGELFCAMAAPRHAGIAVLGLADKLVPAPREVLQTARRTDGGWRITLTAPSERFTVWSAAPVSLAEGHGTALPARRDGPFVTVSIGTDMRTLEITRR